MPTHALDTLAEFAAAACAPAATAPIDAVHLADALIARQAGGATAEGQALERFCRGTQGGLLAHIAADAAVMRLTEIDDIHRPSCVTVGALSVPVALAFAGDATPPQHVRDALYVGRELALRLALGAGGARLLARAHWPSLIAAPFGAAAVAARLLGLEPARMRHALALALAQVSRGAGRPGGTRSGRWLLFGEAVRSGCLAAQAAADGIDGDVALLGDAWLRAIGGELAAPASLFDDTQHTAALSIKPHASAKQALAAVHALRDLMAQHALAASDIEEIELHVPPAYAPMLDREPPRANRLASLVNAPWQLALAALQPQLLDDVAREHWPDDPRLPAFAQRVRVQPDAALDALYPACFPARLVLHAQGARHERLVTDSPGDPALRYGADAVLDKARRMLGAQADLAPIRAALDAWNDPSALARVRAGFR